MTLKITTDADLKDRVYKAPSPIHGNGLFAGAGFGRDEYIGTYAGPEARRNGKYVLWITADDGTVTGVRGLNLLRYLNHSVTPNAYFDGVDLYALRRIAAGTEITFIYGWDDAC